MKKSLTILLVLISVASIFCAAYEYQKANQLEHKLGRVEITLNEKIRTLEDSFFQASKALEVEKRNAHEARKMAESMVIEMEKLRNK